MLTFQERVLCGNPLQRFGSGLEPDPEPTREFGPVANTSCIHNMESLNLANSIIHIVLAAFLAFLFTFLITTLFFNNTCIDIIMISKILCLSVNARHQLQDRSIRCSCLQNEC